MTVNRREFLQKAGLGALQLGLAGYFSGPLLAEAFKTSQLPRSLPELQGVTSSGILDFVNSVEAKKLNLHSLMVLRHGKVLAEGWWAPYAPNLKHTLYSLSKSFTSSAIGFAVDAGKLTVNDKIISFFPKDIPAEISENLAKMRVRDLLTMSTGHDKDSTPALRESGKSNWVKSFLAQPVVHEPGTFFVYNSGATYILSAIIQKVIGQTVLEYLTPRLFKPLGIEGADWEVDPNGINTGGWGLRVKTEDIAKFGQLYLQKGMWNGKRILSEAWIQEATTSHIQSKGGSGKKEDNDWQQGYGYQFWRCRHGAYRGDGAYGQYCIVMPKQHMVIAITSETGNMGAILNEVWNHILPAVKSNELTANVSEQQQLKQKLTSLGLPLANGKSSSEQISKVSGKKFGITENSLKVSQVSLSFKADSCVFSLTDDKGTHQITAGLNKWIEGFTDLSTIPLKLVLTPVPGETKTKIAANGTWINDKTFEMTWRFIETAHYETVTCEFEEENIKVAFRRSLAILGNTKDSRPVLTGKVAV
ncbi:serine hydrolase domain-containing protein [Dyadobacter psychrotolerans]|uniref:Class C beta-lactamase-related serine hydrolase n=1 Tax=Dyadobacter psychrotolerans TaxID=2541721 RepID=A0A4R5DQI8_9BACT|nr:serine hydrolase [Dyadobacter psychrotolerans]TDE16646.1 class C beta-lactamase-related serine hydrolase [Dyadobacter psychrotolerans]